MSEIRDDSCLGEIFFYSLKKYGDKILLHNDDTNEAITYKDIFIQSVRTALRLKEKGITRNDIISICSHNQTYSCLPIIAAQYLGAISANLDPSQCLADTVHLLKIAEPKIIFVSEEVLNFMERCINEANIKTELVVFGSSDKYSQFSEYLRFNKEEENFYPLNIDEKETALMTFSSGTTASPKGICLSHKCLKLGGINFLPFSITNKNPPVSLNFSTFYWITAHVKLINSILNGYTYVICKKFDPVRLWRQIEKYKVTFTFIPTHNVFGCINAKPENVDCSSLEVLMTGGFPVTQNLMNNLRKAFPYARIVNIYGQSEAGGLRSSFDPSKEEEYNLQLKKPSSSGRIKNCTQWKIVDLDSEESLGPNQEGELRLKAISPMNGYYKMDSSSCFDSEGFFKTGDVAYYDEDNCIFIVDRVKEMFKYKGWHILPAKIEGVLLSHPAVKEAAVIGIPNECDRALPMGVLVLDENYANINTNDILNYTNERVCEYEKLRAGLKVLKCLPKTSTGKLKRREVKRLILEETK